MLGCTRISKCRPPSRALTPSVFCIHAPFLVHLALLFLILVSLVLVFICVRSNWYLCAAHTEEDIGRTLKAAASAFEEIATKRA